MGNRTRAETIAAGASQLTNYTYNIANQLISDGAQSFSYDANGRLISAGDRSYTYSLNDRLIALSQPGLSATFAYNGDGVRLAQTANGSQTRYLVDTQRSYSEVVGAITPESETWYLLGLDVLGQQQGSDWSYYAYDGLGSVRLALDSNGSPRAEMRYEPYGLPAASWGTPPALGFTGEWTDSSGLLYLRARYLDPSSATFLSRDPFEGLPTRALSRNGYAWVEGNPVMRVDPSGMISVEQCWPTCQDRPCAFDFDASGAPVAGCSGGCQPSNGFLSGQFFRCLSACQQYASQPFEPIDPLLGTMAMVFVRQVQQRAVEGIVIAAGDGPLPVGDALGVLWTCVGAIEGTIAVIGILQESKNTETVYAAETLRNHRVVPLARNERTRTCEGQCPSEGFDHCRIDRVTPPGRSKPHFGCPGDHVHIIRARYNLKPYPACQCMPVPQIEIRCLHSGEPAPNPPCSPMKTFENWG